ncbi:MAG: PAN domain-containing protein, partial [Pseudomonadota bacterium]
MRASIVLAALIGLSGTAISEEDGYSHEQKTYRFGGTYKVIAATDVQSCANRCQLEDVCLAWSFQRETQGLGTARCELKSSVGRAEENALMVSGISPRL